MTALHCIASALSEAYSQVYSSSSLRAIVEYEDVVIAICVQKSDRAGREQLSDEFVSDIAAALFERSKWNFTSADAAVLETLGAWPLLESNPFLQNILQSRASSAHSSQDDASSGLSYDASFYHGIIHSIQDKFRIVFVQHNPAVRGSEGACLRATQCNHAGCMALLRAGLLPIPINIANVTHLFPSGQGQPWLISSPGEAHPAGPDKILKAAQKIEEWANQGAQFRLLEELTQDNFALYTFSRPIVIFFTGVADSHNVAIKRVLRAAAARFLHLVRFGHLNGLRYHGLALKMGVDYPSPSIVLVDNAKNFSAVTCSLHSNHAALAFIPNLQVFPRNEAVSLATVARWVSAHLAGTLAPTLRSGPGADDKWLQASQWHVHIQENSQNMKFTLVAFTARWCGFCKGVPPLIRIVDQVKRFAKLSAHMCFCDDGPSAVSVARGAAGRREAV